MENVQWSVCLVHSDGISSSSGGGSSSSSNSSSSISSTKKRVNSGVIGRLEGFQSVDPVRNDRC